MHWTFTAYGIFGECVGHDNDVPREILIDALENWWLLFDYFDESEE